MEKKKNGLYLASSIISYISASVLAVLVVGLVAFVVLCQSALLEIMVDGAVVADPIGAEYTADDALAVLTSMIIYYSVLCIPTIVMGFIIAGQYRRFAKMTDQEASEKWGRGIAFAILGYAFGGLLIGGLATAGLCVGHREQREAYLTSQKEGNTTASNKQEVNASENTSASAEVKKESVKMEASADLYSPENLELMKARLIKIKELKDSGVITDEEFEALKSNVIKKESPVQVSIVEAKETDAVKYEKINERLAKLNKLKEAGAVSDEEYESLREKILNADK